MRACRGHGLHLRFSEVNRTVLGKPAGEGESPVRESRKGQAFIDAAKKYNLDVTYLVAASMVETGYGSSTLAQGVYVTTPSGEQDPGRGVKENLKPCVYKLWKFFK